MKYLRSFGRFWWNFVVGEDWRLAADAGVLMGLIALLTHEGVNAWWLLPVGIAVMLTGSLQRAAERDQA